MLTVIGDLLADVVVLGVSAIAVGTDNPAVITHARGGSAANVAAAAAPFASVRFIGRVGTDAEGDALVQTLAATGVDVRVQRGGRTGSIVILVDETAERTMLTDRGAVAELEAIDPAWLEGTEWLHLPLYGLVPATSRAALIAAAAHVRARGVPLSIDLSSVAAMDEVGAGELSELLRVLDPDVVFANADEAQLAEDEGLVVAASAVLVVKRGPQPVLVRIGEEVIEVEVEPVPDLIDTTGAGDAFAAGYLIAAMGGEPPRECATAGAVSARGALHRPGAI